MDILSSNSLDVPYEDTTYKAVITDPKAAVNSTERTVIYCEKVQTKRYEELTYFKFILPMGIQITSEQDVYITVTREDNYCLTFQVPIKSNIIRGETTIIKWYKQESASPSLNDYARETMSSPELALLEQLRRLGANPNYPPVLWAPATTSRTIGGSYIPPNVTYSSTPSITGLATCNSGVIRASISQDTINDIRAMHAISPEDIATFMVGETDNV